MKTKTSHTPTPWEINEDHGKEPRMVKINPVDSHIGLAAVFGDTDEEAMANAAFIVRACNSHEELLSAAKQALTEISEWHRDSSDEQDCVVERNLALAIAKAEGKS